jgi:hypothetical protein
LVSLFGSTFGHRFVLDTVFVIGSGAGYVIGGPGAPGQDVPDLFHAVNLEPLAASEEAGRPARLYRGVMYRPGRPKIFSFVPVSGDCSVLAVGLPGLIDSAVRSTMTSVTALQASAAWRQVVAAYTPRD